MGLREYLNAPEPVSPLRKSLQQAAGFRDTLRKTQRNTHHEEQWGYFDYDDPGETEGVEEDENAIVDQEAVAGRPHRPGYHGKGGRSAVVKSGETGKKPPKKPRQRKIDPTYQHPDGSFKGGFAGAVRYFQHHGYSKEEATKIAGKIAAAKGN